MNAISLFSSAGIGDLGLRQNGIETVIACELLEERMDLFKTNFPTCKCHCGNIEDYYRVICDEYLREYDKSPFLLIATPPCQGMSSNGMGKLLHDYRKGMRPKLDPRNRLIVPAVEAIKILKPKWVILENVANMANTAILDSNGNLVNILEFIKESLGSLYVGTPAVIDCADYGIAQHRRRLITVLSRSEKAKAHFSKYKTFIPKPTNGENALPFLPPWKTLRDSISAVPPLASENGKNANIAFHPLHKVPLLDEKKLFWLKNTPEGASAFNNQCVNPTCMYQKNAIHGSIRDGKGINRYNGDTPIYCQKCAEILPRPWVDDLKTGAKRLMKGYVSAYKRMSWDEPASTITKNFQYACSDNKVHPSQNRVLSLYEALVVQSISEYDYSFSISNKQAKDGLIRDVIGESVPPKMIDLICQHIKKIECII